MTSNRNEYRHGKHLKSSSGKRQVGGPAQSRQNRPVSSPNRRSSRQDEHQKVAALPAVGGDSSDGHAPHQQYAKPTSLSSTGVTQVEIDAAYAGQRLDNFLFNQWKGLPKTKVYQLMRKGYVRLDKKRVKPSTRLYAGAQLRLPPVYLPSKGDAAVLKPVQAEQLRGAILFEDETLLVIDKPAGWAVHGGSGVQLGVIEALRQVFPEYKHLELVHRLDRETSGCLLVAKKRSTLKALHESFRDHTIEKIYWVLVSGVWPKRKTVVRAPLKRFVAANGERFVRVDHEVGQPARTDFEVIEQFDQATLLKARLHTGKTHQIRVHCAAQGCPVVGDLKYGEPMPWAKVLGARQFLHCLSLKPPRLAGLPDWGVFDAPLDNRLEALLSQLRTVSAGG